ncbi:MAG: glycoside hydrolase family 3 protein [Chloroflexi bacterium]|nr:glycoside hydrolase family 3 protein [Chloroflexota bacterium]
MTEAAAHGKPAYLDVSRSFEERAKDLVSLMTLQEKVSQMVHDAPEIDRLGIPSYNYWNECLHGVARAGIATVFPQAIGMAATFNTALVKRMAEATSDEARAKHHEFVRQGDHGIYKGLTFWTPNINIFRDPRWGRGQETYGEDPFLTSRMGVAMVEGLQGDHPRYLKLAATAKHFAVHSAPEADRHHFDAIASPRDMRETYLPAFEALVREAKVEAVMGAYNRTNGEACCASTTLLADILRDEWDFQGHVVSDCWAIRDIWENHKIASSPEEGVAMAVKAGCDINCGEAYLFLLGAVEQGLIDEKTIDTAVERVMTTRMRLGMFDPPEMVPYTSIPYSVNDSEEHRALSHLVAQESLVLLKNDGTLPLKEGLKIAVVGPNAADAEVLVGNYSGQPSRSVTPLEGIRAAAGRHGGSVLYARGCGLLDTDESGFSEAVAAATYSDLVIACVGISQLVEGEEDPAKPWADRPDIDLPVVQQRLLEALARTGKPLVVVLLNGSALAVNWADSHAQAILEAWYPGEEGGTAIAEALFGEYNPGGRLPITFYTGVEQLPPLEDYAMQGRTYRFFEEQPLYPFGFGLSYTQFAYSDLEVTPRVAAGQSVNVSVRLTNVGPVAGDEVVQVYLTDDQASYPVPLRSLVSFDRVHLAPGESRRVGFTIGYRQLAAFDDEGTPVVEPGTFTVSVGGGQPIAQGGAPFVTGRLTVAG